MALAPEQAGIGIRRHFTTEGVHPYDELEWERRDARITNFRDGSVAFEQRDVEFPTSWSLNATNIVAQKYFRGTLGTPEREWSLRQVIDRVADTITRWGVEGGYFVDDAEADTFNAELKHLLVTQKAAFNSPVWFNIGVHGVPQQASACQPYHAPVSTPDGPVPIGRLVELGAVGAKVYDAHGLTRIVAVKHNGRKPVLRVHTRAGHVLDVTGDHLVWCGSGPGAGRFVPAGELRPGDPLDWHRTPAHGAGEITDAEQAAMVDASLELPGQPPDDPARLEIERVESLGEMDVYDIQTESGEYLSGDLRVHNCFILAVDDSMDSILNWYREEGVIFKGGSGAGVNLSRIRSSVELLRGGGTASGPVSFMRGADASAGTIKSGGKTRRAAKMVILDVDHPDIEEFIWCKALEERKARVLEQAGFDMDLDGRDSHSIQYQNANNSVRVTDEFMQAVVDDADWSLREVTSGKVVRTVKARELFRQIAQAAWECADPGMQFDTTINHWHTAANTGRINGSNPCSEYMHLDNSACNLASLNLLKFLRDDESFDVDGFRHAVQIVFTGQEILVGRADYPTESIADTSRRFRQLGLGYANLGALLMALGLPYDSDAGRAYAAAVTSLMTGHAYEVSARTASRMGPFAGFPENREHMLRVLRQHQAEAAKIDEELVEPDLLSAAQESWDLACELAEQYGVRNSQASVLAPTGCLVGGSLVATSHGLVRLGSLGDPDGPQWQDVALDVLTDDGVQRATRFYANGLEAVVDVVTDRGYRIKGTAKHRIRVVDADRGEWVWRRFADLRAGDRVPLAVGQMFGEPREIALPPLPPLSPTPAGAGVEQRVSAPRTMTADLAELAGYVMGAGSVHARGLRLRVADGDLDVVAHLQRLAKELFGVRAPVRPERGHASVELGSARLAEWWQACGFAGRPPEPGRRGAGDGPHIPDAVLHSNDAEVYRAFVRGLFEAGGTVTSGCPSWTTTRSSFADEVQSLLLALGFTTARQPEAGNRGPALPVVSVVIDRSLNARWLDEVGFIAERKALAVDPGADDEPGRPPGFCFDRLASVELGGEELTYDLSVPANVTYVANGFISHNTIGLMMDCDTTGVEPDLGLVKTKKLVGGGTMSIVNQTVPRALEQLGYGPGEIDDIVAYIDEHKSIVGAPNLLPEHLPVFACSMGDNPIHYAGHVTMMGAVQPFISGAISKTVNMPEDVSVEDVAQLHVDAWRMGVKAIAIYRDNCKVGQPLSTTKKAAASAQPRSAAATGDPQAAAAQVVEKIIKVPVRAKLPRNRASKTFEFRVADCKGFVTIGEYADGRPGEIFLKVSKQGSTLAGIMDAFSISVSYGLQYGVPLRSFVEAFTNTRFEPAGITDDPDLRIATSILDYIFRRLAVDYLSHEERAELGILTTGERTQPTLPGVEETVVETRQGQDVPADPPSFDSSSPTLFDSYNAPKEPSLLERAGVTDADKPATGRPNPVIRPRSPANVDAPYCMQCGVQMQRAGSCHACPSCGSTSGCS